MHEPKISIILPCKGAEKGLLENINSILDQDYKLFELIFVTTPNDPSLHILEEIHQSNKLNTKICLSSHAQTCSQKMENQFCALKEVSENSEYLLFLDSDGKLDRSFLGHMHQTICKPNVGLATGWRWYIPQKKSPLSFIRSAWNAAVFPFLIDNKHNIAFGGAMMIKKKDFYDFGAYEVWQKILSDGLTLAKLTKENGKTVCFDSRCIVISTEVDTCASLLEWTNRQTTISKIYMNTFWRMTSFGYLAQLILLFSCLVTSIFYQKYELTLLCITCYALSLLINVFLLLRGITSLLNESIATDIRRYYFQYMLWAPFANILYGVNIIRSLCSKIILWRGIKYKMISNHNTIIIK